MDYSTRQMKRDNDKEWLEVCIVASFLVFFTWLAFAL